MKLHEPKYQTVTQLDTFDVADRISLLPEPLLQHIMSFLLVKNAAKTSLVSKTFYDAWSTLPHLNFGDCFFPVTRQEEEKMRKQLDLVDLMITTRLKHKSSNIHKFLLQLKGYIIDLNPYINSFMGAITEGNIKELVFLIQNRLDKSFTLPEAVYASKTLCKLHLQGFNLVSPSGGVQLSSLLVLHLSRTYLDNNIIQLFISGCPNLEDLKFNGCKGFDSLQIVEALKLKRIKIYSYDTFDNLKKIEIQAPSLEYLYYYSGGRLLEVNLGACKSLNYLNLHKIVVPVNWVNDLLSSLPLLEYLYLTECEGFETIHTSSNRLKNLFIWDCVNLVSIELDTVNLSSFEYIGDLSINLSLKAPAIQDITVSPPKSTPWCQNKLFGFLEKLNHAKAVTLNFNDPQKAIVTKDMRRNFHSPLYGVKSLTLDHYYHERYKSMFFELLDTLLWIAPCLDSLSLVYIKSKSTLKFIHEKSPKDEVEDNSCCLSLPINCWRHSLKKVKCVNFQDVAGQEELRNYFVENAKMLESVDFVQECDL